MFMRIHKLIYSLVFISFATVIKWILFSKDVLLFAFNVH